MKIKSRKNSKLMGVIFTLFTSVFDEEIFVNHEYENDIRPLYKGSIKESKILRFKERFRNYKLTASFSVLKKCEEVI